MLSCHAAEHHPAVPSMSEPQVTQDLSSLVPLPWSLCAPAVHSIIYSLSVCCTENTGVVSV